MSHAQNNQIHRTILLGHSGTPGRAMYNYITKPIKDEPINNLSRPDQWNILFKTGHSKLNILINRLIFFTHHSADSAYIHTRLYRLKEVRKDLLPLILIQYTKSHITFFILFISPSFNTEIFIVIYTTFFIDFWYKINFDKWLCNREEEGVIGESYTFSWYTGIYTFGVQWSKLLLCKQMY